MSEDLVRVRIRNVEMPSEEASPVVVLEEASGGGEFSVAVGAAEAGAILLELEGIATPRPLTHELMVQVLREQGLTIRRVEVYGLYGADEDGFLARLEYSKGFRSWVRDVRPSDALALAVASGAPVFAHRSLLCGSSNDWLQEARRA
ncbi:MAG TPA: bifunctional nuclease family protein [Spirochaetia bacterium]|nr:bifunctional nuclease family protein [Spirochaetaceae bacterium]HPE89460.1 bifunctional nuclease family protein [Spirochaetales bacterium]HRW23620.1 bifunctional nuclease family protein [Spirochaetia bacterium]